MVLKLPLRCRSALLRCCVPRCGCLDKSQCWWHAAIYCQLVRFAAATINSAEPTKTQLHTYSHTHRRSSSSNSSYLSAKNVAYFFAAHAAKSARDWCDVRAAQQQKGARLKGREEENRASQLGSQKRKAFTAPSTEHWAQLTRSLHGH